MKKGVVQFRRPTGGTGQEPTASACAAYYVTHMRHFYYPTRTPPIVYMLPRNMYYFPFPLFSDQMGTSVVNDQAAERRPRVREQLGDGAGTDICAEQDETFQRRNLGQLQGARIVDIRLAKFDSIQWQ